MLNNLEQMHLKLLKKENSKSEATGGLAGILLINYKSLENFTAD